MPPEILLRSTGSGYQHRVLLRWQDGTFVAHLSPGSMPGLLAARPAWLPTAGYWPGCPDRARRAADIRRRLGLPAGQRIVLYAPTWRDDAPTRAAGYGFPQLMDLGAVARALGTDHVMMVRAHQAIREAVVTGATDSRVIDVTSYADMADLLLIGDVLITDYSSAMFDFAVTGRPMLFFTYDLERYRDRLPGFLLRFRGRGTRPAASHQ
jgi:CDP-glycerol glycerophosphotransferase